MNVSAIIVTRGNVDLTEIVYSLPDDWEILVWDNSDRLTRRKTSRAGDFEEFPVTDLSVAGRYAAIEYASHDCIYVQDDDVIVSNPLAIAQLWRLSEEGSEPGEFFTTHPTTLSQPVDIPAQPGSIVANMPQEFRHSGYTDSCLVGFGACFHRDAPARAFDWFFGANAGMSRASGDLFDRTCDVVFTTLTPRVLTDIPKTNLDYATGADRMYRQPDHVGERARMLELAKKVRDA